MPPRGYERCEQVEGAGQYSVRGGIIDIVPAGCPSPVRIELWGDSVDTIWYYDVLSQRRTEPLKEISISPAAEIMPDRPDELASNIEELAEGLRGKNAAAAREILMADCELLRGGGHPASYDKYIPLQSPQPCSTIRLSCCLYQRGRGNGSGTTEWQHGDIKSFEGQLCRGLTEYMMDSVGVQSELESRGCIMLEAFARSGEITLNSLYNINARQLPVWSGGMDLLTEDLQNLLNRNMACIVLAGAEEKTAETLASDLVKRGIPPCPR